MAKNYEVKAKVDMSQHDASLKKSSFEIYKYEKNIKNAKAELNNFNQSVNGTIGGLGNLASALGRGDFMGFANELRSTIPNLTNLSGGLSGVGGALTSLINPATLAAAGIAAVGAVVVSSISKVSEFETHLDSLQSLTGLDDSGMKAISDAAIEMSKNFPASASAIVDSMKLIGSQAPELLKDKDALLQVTEAANILAGAAQIEVVDAAKAITTTMKQMGVSGAQAKDIINVLAAASQQGSADVAYLNTAFEKVGTAAASAGMNYTELAAIVESVAPKFSSADVAGSQLNSTMLALSTQANDNFKPAVVGMQTALDNLAAAQLNDAELKKLVGESNITMVKTLIQAKDQFAQYSQTLQGTNTAQEQFAINTDNLQGAIQKLKNTWDALLLTLGESGIIQEWIKNIQLILTFLGNIINKVSELLKVFDLLGGEGTKNINLLAVQLKSLEVVINTVFEILQVSITIAIKAFINLRDIVVKVWTDIIRVLNSNGLFRFAIKQLNDFINKFLKVINRAISIWNLFREALGAKPIGNGSSGGGGSGIRGENNKEPEEKIEPPKLDPTPKFNRKIGKNGTTTTTKKNYQDKSIADYNEKIREQNDLLKNQNLTLEQQRQKIEEIVSLEQERDKLIKQQEGLKAETEIASKFGQDIVDQYKKATGSTSLNPEFFKDVTTRKEAEQRIQDFLNSMKVKLSISEIKKPNNISVPKLTSPRERAEAPFKALQEKYNEGWINESQFLKQWDNLKKIVEDSGLEVTVEPQVRESAMKKSLNGAADTLNNLGDAIAQLGQMGENNALSAAGIIAQAIASMWLGYAQATAGAGKLGPWGWAAFAAAGLAQTLAVISQIHSNSYAEGGIINGASRIGDYNIARVNGGEMILNGQQQANLWKAISHNRLGGDGTTLVASDVRIKGSDLYLALSNYGKIKGKSGHKLNFG